MKNILKVLILLFSTSLLADDITSKTLKEGQYHFLNNLYGQIRGQKGNIVISPYSIHTALSMAYMGAGGDTSSEFEKVLGINKSSEIKNEIRETYRELNKKDSNVSLSIANAFYTQAGYKFLESYEDSLKDTFNSEPHSVDFKNDPEDAREEINEWVEDKTDDLIKDLIPPGEVTGNTRGVLVNAIYFNGKWLVPFEAKNTKLGDFKNIDGELGQTKFLNGTFDTQFFENQTLQAINIHYKNTRFSMLILLPQVDSKQAFTNLEESINANFIGDLHSNLDGKEVQISIPKFQSEYQISLSEDLAKLGLESAFDGSNANFSNMSTEKGLHISGVIHKAYIEVDEEGTKAAAATSITMDGMLARAPPDEPPKVFKADHPFMFLVLDNKTGLPLFVGRKVE